MCYHSRKGGTLGFIADAIDVHTDTYDYSISDYMGVHTKLKIICKVHGEFLQTPAAHLRLKQGCRKCSITHRSKLRHEEAKANFTKDSNSLHGYLYDYSKVVYVKSNEKVEIICSRHGSFWQTPNNHLSGKGCVECSPGGFDNRKSGYVYTLQAGNLLKVGITNKSPAARAKTINKQSKKDFILIKSLDFEDGAEAELLENILLKELRKEYNNPSEKFNGYTECFYDADVNKLLDLIKNLKALPKINTVL